MNINTKLLGGYNRNNTWLSTFVDWEFNINSDAWPSVPARGNITEISWQNDSKDIKSICWFFPKLIVPMNHYVQMDYKKNICNDEKLTFHFAPYSLYEFFQSNLNDVFFISSFDKKLNMQTKYKICLSSICGPRNWVDRVEFELSVIRTIA